jgi:hypothetical protein
MTDRWASHLERTDGLKLPFFLFLLLNLGAR